MITSISIFSLGLIGGSIAKALKAAYPTLKIQIYARREETIRQAVADGVCDIGSTHIEPDFCKADYIFLCAPVSANVKMLEEMKPYLAPHTIITDVGSVKTDIHKHIEALGLESQFIGGHPMAGSEKTGFENASARLLENAFYVLTPARGVDPARVQEYQDMIKNMHAIPVVLDYQKHDYATAGISHLPHVIAYSLVNLIREKDKENGTMKLLAAGGFKDITRIASSSPDMWEQICLTNKENILSLLDDYEQILEDVRKKILSNDAESLKNNFQCAKDYRDSFSEKETGPIKPSFFFHLDIADVPGAIAHIATILALHEISIKNIGIVHNREFEEGALRVEFYDQESMDHAIVLMNQNQMTLFERK